MSLLSSILAYYLYVKAQAKLEITEVSVFTYLSPLFSLPASYLILGEVPSQTALIGLSVILLGVVLTKFNNQNHKRR